MNIKILQKYTFIRYKWNFIFIMYGNYIILFMLKDNYYYKYEYYINYIIDELITFEII